MCNVPFRYPARLALAQVAYNSEQDNNTSMPKLTKMRAFQVDDLATFLKLAASENLSETARALKIPKSQVSRAVARLEAATRIPLFERSSRHFRLSDAGKTLLPHAARVLEEIEHARSTLDNYISEPQGLLKVNTSPAFAQGIVAPMLATYLEQYPQVRVELVVEQQLTNLAKSEADVVVRIGRIMDTDYIAKRLTPVPVWLCGAARYLAASAPLKDPADLQHHQIIGRDALNHWVFHRGAASRAVDLPAHIAVEDAATCRILIESGAGLGCLPSFLAAPAIASGRLIRVLETWSRKPIEVHAMHRRYRMLSPKVKTFVQELSNFMARADA